MSKQKLALFILLALAMSIVLLGCSDGRDDPAVEAKPISVYDDGQYVVECFPVENSTNGEAAGCVVRLRVTNRSAENIALSSVLGLRVTSADGAPCALLDPAPAIPIDGLVLAGATAEGAIAFLPPEGSESFAVELAVDYADDDWLSFTVSR